MKTCLAILLSALATFSVAQRDVERVLAKAQTAYREGRDAYYDGDYAYARQRLETSLAFWRKLPGHDTARAYAKTHWALADAYRRLRVHDKALDAYDSTEQAYRCLPRRDDLDFADIDFDRARVYSQMYLPHRAMATYASVRTVYAASFGAQSREVAQLDMNVGLDLVKAGEYRAAEERLLRALDIFRITSDSLSEDFNRVYGNLGYLYAKLGDHHRALRYGRQALRIKLHNYDAYHPSVAKYHNNIAKALAALGRYEEAIPYGEQSLEVARRSLGDSHPTTAGAYGDLSGLLADAGQYRRARRLLVTSNRLMADAYVPTHPYRVAGVHNLGLLEEEAGDYEAALRAYREARALIELRDEPLPSHLAEVQVRIASVYCLRGQPDSAVAALRSALGMLMGKDGLPGYRDAVADEPVTLEVLRALALSYLAFPRFETDTAACRAGLEASEAGAAVARRLRAGFPSEEARQLLREQLSDLYGSGIEASHNLYALTGEASWLERALVLSNESKAALLRDRYRATEMQRLVNLPDSTISLLHELAARVRASAHGSAEYLKSAEALEQAQRTVRRTYPRYAALLGSGEPLDVGAVRAALAPTQQLLDLVVHNDQLMVTAISREGVEGRKVRLPESFASWLAEAKQLGQVDRHDEQCRAAQLRALVALHDVLFPPELLLADRLVVCPDDHLAGLAFDALIDGDNGSDWRDQAYLGLRHAMSIAWAPELILQPSAAPIAGSQSREVLAFAPTFGGAGAGTERSTLGPLIFAGREAANLSKHFTSRVVVGAEATKARFLAAAGEARVLHLATHGTIDGDDPLRSALHFAASAADTNVLTAAEVYGLRLDAELAVLSACHTADGKVWNGEGIMSLSRAFSFAGVRSIVATQWLANDRSIATLIDHFYASLARGKAKDLALREGKRAYVSSADALTSHPAYWAGLRLEGNVEPIDMNYSTTWWNAGGLVLVLVGVAGWSLFRKRAKAYHSHRYIR